MANTPHKESWNTRFGVILAVTGSAVGLGNFLRFPGMAARYGGGAFLIPYFIAFLIIGIPLAWSEWALGRYGGKLGHNSAPGIFRGILKRSSGSYLGMLGTVMPVLIYTYYLFVEAWCLYYAWHFLRGTFGTMGGDAEAVGSFFESAVGVNAHGAVFSRDGTLMLLFIFLCFVLNFGLIYRGLSQGIEKFCSVAMPLLVVCAVVILVRVLTLPAHPAHPDQTVLNGLGYLWNPGQPAEVEPGLEPTPINETTEIEMSETGDEALPAMNETLAEMETENGESEEKAPRTFGEHLANPETWLAATGQIFFSLSLGFGLILTYASYLKKDDDVCLSSLTSAAGNGFCEIVLGGMIVIPAAFVFLGPALMQDPPGTFGMGFVVLPNVFSLMPAGQFFGFLFFALLFLAAVTSSLSMLQPAIALLEEGLGITRKPSVAILGFITLTGCMFVVWFSKGFMALDTIDFWMANFFIFIFATVQTLVFGWVIGKDKAYRELTSGAEIHVPPWIMVFIRYISPAYLLGIFVLWLFRSMPARWEAIVNPPEGEPPVVLLSLGFILMVITFFVLVIAGSNQRWRTTQTEEETP